MYIYLLALPSSGESIQLAENGGNTIAKQLPLGFILFYLVFEFHKNKRNCRALVCMHA